VKRKTALKAIETKMPFCKSVSRWSTLWLLAFGIFLAARAWLVPTVLAQSTYEPYTFTTLAGNAGYGSADGTGSAARFWNPSGVAVDSAGSVYVADSKNHTMRKVTPVGVVTTLAGRPGNPGSGRNRERRSV
jgi:hypothetical protein